MKLVELYDGTLFDCQMIANILENNGIESSLKDEIIGSRGGGWRPAGNVKLIVMDTDYAKAIEIVDEYIRNQNKQ